MYLFAIIRKFDRDYCEQLDFIDKLCSSTTFGHIFLALALLSSLSRTDVVVTLQGGLGDDVYQLNATNAAGCPIEDVTGINTLILEGITLSFDGAAGTIAVLQSGADLVMVT